MGAPGNGVTLNASLGRFPKGGAEVNLRELRFHRCMGKGEEDSGMMRFYNVVEHSYFIVEAFSFQG